MGIAVAGGREITALKFAPQAGPVRDVHLYFDARQKLAAVRKGEWKLFLDDDGGETQAVGDREDGKASGQKKSGGTRGRQPHLYTLREDCGETNDLAVAHPENVARLSAEARKSEAEIHRNKRSPG